MQLRMYIHTSEIWSPEQFMKLRQLNYKKKNNEHRINSNSNSKFRNRDFHFLTMLLGEIIKFRYEFTAI